jgi:energy-coupling factor transport system ATP-binding protein
LNDITLTVEDGEFLGVIGHTGSGKSTLMQHINGLLPPTSGRVVVNGVDLRDKGSRRAARRAVGMAFQYPEHQLFADSVIDDVAFGPRAVGVSDTDARKRAENALERVDLDVCTYGHRSPFDLSGGEMRRVALAGILAMRPGILVLDEPMAGLDPSGRGQIMRIISRLHREGMTIVMVSHDMEDIAAHADAVLVLLNGRVFAHGTPQEVFARGTELREIGLGMPRVARFAARLTELGLPLTDGVLTLDALADAIATAVGQRRAEGVG